MKKIILLMIIIFTFKVFAGHPDVFNEEQLKKQTERKEAEYNAPEAVAEREKLRMENELKDAYRKSLNETLKQNQIEYNKVIIAFKNCKERTNCLIKNMVYQSFLESKLLETKLDLLSLDLKENFVSLQNYLNEVQNISIERNKKNNIYDIIQGVNGLTNTLGIINMNNNVNRMNNNMNNMQNTINNLPRK